MFDASFGEILKPVWNKGRQVGPKRALKPKHIWGIRTRLQSENRTRDLALFDLAIDSKLRGCDLVGLRISEIAPTGEIEPRVSVIQQKTGRPAQFEITENTRQSLRRWLGMRQRVPSDWLWPSRTYQGAHLSTRQYARLVDEWVSLIGLDPVAYGTHSLRRTKVSILYKKTGNLRACQLLLGHRKLESTVRYLGVEIDDALALSEATEI